MDMYVTLACFCSQVAEMLHTDPASLKEAVFTFGWFVNIVNGPPCLTQAMIVGQIQEYQAAYSLVVGESKESYEEDDLWRNASISFGPEQLAQVCLALGLETTPTTLDALLDAAEASREGRAGFKGFCRLIAIHSDPHSPVWAFQRAVSAAREAFLMFDTNADRTVAPAEMELTVMALCSRPAASIADVEQLVSGAGRNVDGGVSFCGFVRNVLGNPDLKLRLRLLDGIARLRETYDMLARRESWETISDQSSGATLAQRTSLVQGCSGEVGYSWIREDNLGDALRYLKQDGVVHRDLLHAAVVAADHKNQAVSRNGVVSFPELAQAMLKPDIRWAKEQIAGKLCPRQMGETGHWMLVSRRVHSTFSAEEMVQHMQHRHRSPQPQPHCSAPLTPTPCAL